MAPIRPARILVEDLEALGRLVEAGLGCAYLPRGFGERLRCVVETRARRIGARDRGPNPARDLWLVIHRSKQ
jgi:DNA-binding transcriptional LysR family regulator